MDSWHFHPPPGLSKEADSTRQPCACTASTEEQVSTLESCFLHRHYLGPRERRRLAWKMGEVQVRPLGPASQVEMGGLFTRSHLFSPTD